ncbi:MAG: thioredoxin family protein [Ferrovibrio sp.]
MTRLFTLLILVLLAPLTAARAGESALVMIQSPGCPYCAKWDREIAPVYEKTEEAARFPLKRVDIAEARRDPVLARALTAPPYYTPTFILMDDGREVGRIIGYSNEFSFWGLFDIEKRKLAALPAPAN